MSEIITKSFIFVVMKLLCRFVRYLFLKFHPGVIVIGWSLEHIIIIIIFYRESRMGGDGEEEEWSTVHVSNIPPYTTR